MQLHRTERNQHKSRLSEQQQQMLDGISRDLMWTVSVFGMSIGLVMR